MTPVNRYGVGSPHGWSERHADRDLRQLPESSAVLRPSRREADSPAYDRRSVHGTFPPATSVEQAIRDPLEAPPDTSGERERPAGPASLLLDRIAEVCETRSDRAKIRKMPGEPPHLLVTLAEDGFVRQQLIRAHALHDLRGHTGLGAPSPHARRAHPPGLVGGVQPLGRPSGQRRGRRRGPPLGPDR
jgi:hypothetical protein